MKCKYCLVVTCSHKRITFLVLLIHCLDEFYAGVYLHAHNLYKGTL